MSFALDGIGIINGYAKSPQLYARNNRIHEITITITRADDHKLWSKNFTLHDSYTLQQLHFPLLHACIVKLTVNKVGVGPDDDLCISELAFYNHGKQIPWHLTPNVAYNLGSTHSDCGGSESCYGVMDSHGVDRRANYWGDMDDQHVVKIYALQPGTSNILMATERHVYLYNLRTDEVLSQHVFTGFIQSMGWVTWHTALIGTYHDNAEIVNAGPLHWYRLDFPADRVNQTNVVKGKGQPKYIPGFFE